MPPEVGFKVKGPESTRYGDWIGRVRVRDFWDALNIRYYFNLK